MCFESFEELEILLFLLLQFEYEFWIIKNELLSINVLSWPFLFYVMMGYSLAIYSTS